ncbi:MAG: hypothetical protein WC924_04835 [Candidatus Gracilibacteria bacterium]
MKLNSVDQILHKQFSEYGLNAKEWLRKCALLLPEIDRRFIWKKKGFSGIYEYAAKLAGMSRGSVADALRIMKKVEEIPALRQIVEEKGLNRIRPLLSIINTENQDFWVEKAKSMSRHTLATYIQNYRLEGRTSPEIQPVKVIVYFQVRPELAKKLEVLKKREDFEELLNRFVESVDRPSSQPEPAKSRSIPMAIKREVMSRTSGLCAYPSCTKSATSLHHTQRFALEKVHNSRQIQALCTAHERLAHLGLIENEEKSPENWRLREEPSQSDYKFYVDRFVRLYRPT